MNKEKMPQESLHIIKQELITITEKLEEFCLLEKEIREMQLEIKGLKLYLGRIYPEFKTQFPDVMKKMVRKT